MTDPGPKTADGRVAPAHFEPPGQGPARKARPAFKPLYLLLLAGLLLFAVAGWFLLTARAVTFEFTPEAERIAISGGFSLELGDRRLMRPGQYQVEAGRAGYQPFSQRIEVKPGENPDFSFKLEKLPGRLTVTSDPPGAQVSVDGKAVGNTPLDPVSLSAGEHEVVLRAERYEVFRQTVDIEGLDRLQTLEAKLTPAWAAIAFSTDPPGATVEIDGKARGTTPVTVDVGAGEHSIAYRLAGYESREQSLRVVANKPQTLERVKLVRASGKLSVTSEPPGASITVGGQFQGRTPATVALPPDQSSTVKLSKAGYQAASRSFKLAAGDTQSARFELEPILGDIEVLATPADASLFVDGEDRGPARQTLRLTAAPHKIAIRKAGFESHEVTVTPKPGTGQRLAVTLKSLAQAKAESVPASIRTFTGQQMKLLQPGRFVMGAPRREQGRQSNEVEQPVKLTRAFYLSVHEVSNADYRKFKSRHSSGIVQRTTLDNDNYPVVRVSWEDAVAFCNWLSEQDGLPPAYAGGKLITPVNTGYRLPTEAEWAYAARFAGGRNLKYDWGQSMPPTGSAGNYADKSSAVLLDQHLDNYDDGYRAAAPVGSFAANAVGIHDMGGNVSEWVNDRTATISLVSKPELVDPLGLEGRAGHMLRGSSWRHGRITELRLSWRDSATQARDDLGFRIARYAE